MYPHLHMLTCSGAFAFDNLGLSDRVTQHPAHCITGTDRIVLRSKFILCVSIVNVFSLFYSQTS